jgi:hypothetical protein
MQLNDVEREIKPCRQEPCSFWNPSTTLRRRNITSMMGRSELTPEQLSMHVRRNTAVARWLERTLG